MVELILITVLIIGVILMFIPEYKAKKVNTPMLGLFLIAITCGYVIILGTQQFAVHLINFIKGWF